MSKKNKKKSLIKQPKLHANGKTGGENFRQFQSFISTIENADKLKKEELEDLYIKHLINNDKVNKREAGQIMNWINNRLEKSDNNNYTREKQIFNKLEDGKDKVKIGKESNFKYKKRLDKEFNKYLASIGIDNRDRDDIYILLENFLSSKSNLSESTKNNIRSAVSFMQDEKYQKKYKNSEIKTALRDLARKKNNTKNDIQVPKNLLKAYNDNLNNANVIFRKLYSKDAVNPTVFKQHASVNNFIKWYTFVSNGSPIKKATREDYQNYIKYMKQQGYAANTQHYFMKSIRKYSKLGEWEYKFPKTNKIFNLDKRYIGKVSRAWSGDEFIKAFNYASQGTGKNGGCKRPDVALYLLTVRIFGERADECLNMTTEQFKSAINNEYLKLTKTKGLREREIPAEIINMFNGTFHLLEPFIAICERDGINKPFIELFERHTGKKAHNIKASYQQWVNHHRDKFQDEDRLANSVINEKMSGKKRNEVEIEKANLSLHGLRHALAQECFQHYYMDIMKNAHNDIDYMNNLIDKHRNDSIKKAIERKWSFTKDYTDKKVRENALLAQIAIEAKKLASEVLGHSRPDILNCYLAVKINSNTTVKININTLQSYMITENEDGGIEIISLDDLFEDVVTNIDNIE